MIKCPISSEGRAFPKFAVDEPMRRNEGMLSCMKMTGQPSYFFVISAGMRKTGRWLGEAPRTRPIHPLLRDHRQQVWILESVDDVIWAAQTKARGSVH